MAFTERKFYGTTPVFFVYFMVISFSVFALFVTLFTLVMGYYLVPLFFLPLVFLIIWVIARNKISWVHFKEKNLSIDYVIGPMEFIEYANLKTFSVKVEGFHGKSMCSIQYIDRKGKTKQVDFFTKGLDLKKFKAQLTELKSNPI